MLKEEFRYYNHLGFHNPYYIYNQEKKIVIEDSYEKLFPYLEQKEIDLISLVQVLSAGYSFGDRSLIKGINKTPWMAKPSLDREQWDYYNLPPHKENVYSQEEIADKFYQLLKKELYGYVREHNEIGILLTGGMDSRIVACILNEMIVSGELLNKRVIGLTWGNELSRDVVYARRICDLFNWEWKHLVVDKEQMFRNIDICVDLGCEFTPIHLHAMEQVANMQDIDCVLAGSFGDSVGRAEYSGVNVKKLKSLDTVIKNPAYLIRESYVRKASNATTIDLQKYHQIFPQEKAYMLNEQDQELHYMRKMLNACMSLINKKIPLYQMFSSPDVFGYIWSISPDLRDNSIYRIILETKNKDLLLIPWARTGLVYPEKNGNPDKFNKRHHDYGNLIREEMLSEIEATINNSSLFDMNFLNKKSVQLLVKLCRQNPIQNYFYYEEKLIYLAAVSKFIDKHSIVSNLEEFEESSFYYLLTKGEYHLRRLAKKVMS